MDQRAHGLVGQVLTRAVVDIRSSDTISLVLA